MFKGEIGTLQGFNIIEDYSMVESYAKRVKIPLLERFLSLRWLTKYKTITDYKPSKEIISYDNKLVMHPEIARKLYDKS